MKPKELKDKQQKLYQDRVQEVQNDPSKGKPIEPNSMFESVNIKKPSKYKLNFK